MKANLLFAVLVGFLAGAVFFLLDSRETTYETPYMDVIDAVVDSGLQAPLDLESESFFAQRAIVSTTDVNAEFSKRVIAQLLVLDGRETAPIDFYLRTEGGWEADAFAVIDTIRALQSPVNIHGMGEVHSAGAMILATATGRRIVYENTVVGFHEVGPDEEEIFEQRYLKLWEKYAQLPQEWLESRNEEMQYFTAEEAVEMGVADEIRGEE